MVLLVRYGEIHLKGLNRPHFERLQKDAIARALKDFDNAEIKKGLGRFYIKGLKDEQIEPAISAIKKVFGLHSVSPAVETVNSLEEIKAALYDAVKNYIKKTDNDCFTFKIEAKRADKRFPLNSMVLAAELGGFVLDNFKNSSVDVHKPDVKFYVEVRENTYIYTDIILCAGGMPQKSNGRAMLLLSGGIDSPVAGYMIAKRGVELNAVHYHSFPYTGEAAKQKVITLAEHLSAYAGKIYLNVISFTDIQTQIHEKCPHDMLVLIMRRFMMRIAERLAKKNDCGAIVTGESIGQVASQTMDSIAVTDCVVNMPVFRPLIGMDKSEIMDRAKQISTYNTSILPYEDCCTVFVPKHPLTRPKLTPIEKAESVLDIEELVNNAVNTVDVIKIDK